jgi:hypothetical protein
MTYIKQIIRKSPITNLRSSFQNFFSANTNSKQAKPAGLHHEVSENRYSVLYTFNGQYHHKGYSSETEAQAGLSMLMTDENRIPIGIYDAKTDSFAWEIIGQYLHSQDPAMEQHSRLEEILTISRALRRRDSSWQPGYLQRPSFFA